METGNTEGDSGQTTICADQHSGQGHSSYNSGSRYPCHPHYRCLLHARNYRDHVTHHTHANMPVIKTQWSVLLSLHRWANWGPEIWNMLVKDKKLLLREAKVLTAIVSDLKLLLLLRARQYSKTDQCYSIHKPSRLGTDQWHWGSQSRELRERCCDLLTSAMLTRAGVWRTPALTQATAFCSAPLARRTIFPLLEECGLWRQPPYNYILSSPLTVCFVLGPFLCISVPQFYFFFRLLWPNSSLYLSRYSEVCMSW